MLGTVEISIYWADNSVLSSAAGITLPGTRDDGATVTATNFDRDGGKNATYSVSNIRMSTPVVAFAGSFYDEMVQSRMSSQGFIELSFKNYFAHQFNHTTSSTVNCSSQSLDRVWTAFRSTTALTQGAPVPITGGRRSNAYENTTNAKVAASLALANDPGFSPFPNSEERYVPKAFKWEEPLAANKTTARMQLNVNGVNMPQSQVTSAEAYALTKQNLLGSYMQCEDKMTLRQYRDNFFVQCLARFNISDGEYERVLSGIDTRNANAAITLTTADTKASDLLMWLECSSSLRIGSGKAIEVIV